MTRLLAILMLIASSSSYACMCRNGPVDVELVFEKAAGIYLAAVSKIEVVNSHDGRAELAVTLTVLATYKGPDETEDIAKSRSPFPTMDSDGGYVVQSTSCDSRVTIGQKFLLAKFKESAMDLGQCSPGVLEASPKNLKTLHELAPNKVLHGTSP